MTAPKSFTIEEMLQAAEQNKYKNFNDSYIDYGDGQEKPSPNKRVPVRACVIGEAFLNLGFVPNGLTPYELSYALDNVEPDNGPFTLEVPTSWGTKRQEHFSSLSDFINTLNGVKGYAGKKRMAKLVRKYFSKSLKTEIKVIKTTNAFGGSKPHLSFEVEQS